MALTSVLRSRIVIDLLQDGTVGNEATYTGSNVEKASVAIASKYGIAFWQAYQGVNPDGGIRGLNASGVPIITISGVVSLATNEQIGTNYINQLRKHHKAVLETVRVPAAAATARQTETTTVATEVASELGVEV